MVGLKRHLLSLALTAPIVCAAAQAHNNEHEHKNMLPRQKWAVLIGVTEPQSGGIGQARSADENVDALAQSLKSQGGGNFPEDHVMCLRDADATTSAIRSIVVEDWLPKKALPDDLIVVYLSGKVVPSTDHADAILFSYDTNPAEPTASGIEIKRLMADLHSRTQSKQICCFLDTSPALIPARNADFKAADITRVQHVAQDCRVAVLSASELFQQSHDSGQSGPSVFCHYLTDGIESDGGQLPLNSLAEFVIGNIRTDAAKVHKSQEALFYPNPDNGELGLLALGTAVKPVEHREVDFGYTRKDLEEWHPELAKKYGLEEPEAGESGESANRAETSAAPAVSGNAPDFSVKIYTERMRKQIHSKWLLPTGVQPKPVIVQFTILHDGSIVEPQITQSSGEPALDRAAMNALRDASPLEPLPPSAGKSTRVQYNFDWRSSQ
jgi:TonB family protein